MQPLTDRDREILEFEERWGVHSGAKVDAMRTAFGLSAARYYQLLNALIEKPAALAERPMLVKRLLQARSRRTAQRQARAIAS